MTQIVSHRGANQHAPENTFAAADKALQLGADYIELDVRQSADGVLYVHHDATLERTTDGHGAFGLQMSDTIDQLDAGSWFDPVFAGEPVPRLDAYLEHLRGRAGVYIEMKWCDPLKLATLVRDLGMVEETFYFSFSEQMRFGLHAVAPEFRKMITLNIAQCPSLAPALFHASIIEMTPAQMRVPQLLQVCRDSGLQTMVYTNSPAPAEHAEIHAAGLDYVNLDHPDISAQARAVTKDRTST